jgi:hypothetical protein
MAQLCFQSNIMGAPRLHPLKILNRNHLYRNRFRDSMPSLTFWLILSVILIAIDPTITLAQNMTNNESINNINPDYGGLSAESVDVAKANETNLIRNTTNSNMSFGGLSTESIEIAKTNESNLIRNASNNETDYGGLSARSVNITE